LKKNNFWKMNNFHSLLDPLKKSKYSFKLRSNGFRCFNKKSYDHIGIDAFMIHEAILFEEPDQLAFEMERIYGEHILPVIPRWKLRLKDDMAAAQFFDYEDRAQHRQNRLELSLIPGESWKGSQPALY
jgi:hypothetical protein